MNSKEFSQLLRKIGACAEACEWAKGKSLAGAWEQCERGDWLLWLCGRMVDTEGWPTRKELVLAACACAETALKYVKAGEDRPRIAIETARKLVRGEATFQEVRDAAAAAAYAAYAAAAAAAAAAYDAAAAANAAYDAYAYAAAAARREESRLAALKQCADIVRATIQLPILSKAVTA